jgi:hypothetical protein
MFTQEAPLDRHWDDFFTETEAKKEDDSLAWFVRVHMEGEILVEVQIRVRQALARRDIRDAYQGPNGQPPGSANTRTKPSKPCRFVACSILTHRLWDILEVPADEADMMALIGAMEDGIGTARNTVTCRAQPRRHRARQAACRLHARLGLPRPRHHGHDLRPQDAKRALLIDWLSGLPMGCCEGDRLPEWLLTGDMGGAA